MERLEAIALLTACRPLADRLAAEGVDLQLTPDDLFNLRGFNEVWLYNDGNWLDDPVVRRQSGLSRSDIAMLHFIAGMQAREKMRRLHEAGEPLE